MTALGRPRNLVREAIWYIDRRPADMMTLGDIAQACGVSRWHLSRAFALGTGCSLMRYLRERRLLQAALQLAGGAPDILEVALDAGYGSHEAFTRAFRDRFGLTPEAVRAQGSLENLDFTEAILMENAIFENIQPSRFETIRPLVVGGIARHYTMETRDKISEQWDEVLAHQDEFPGGPEAPGYGVSYDMSETGDFTYMCGVEVTAELPPLEGWTTVDIPSRQYAVFGNWGHVSLVRQVYSAIYSNWLPNSAYNAAAAPSFELYGDNFDIETLGGLEIWIPVDNK